MKKFNFLNPSPDPSERPGPSRKNVSPQAKALVSIGVVGIVLTGALYWYTHRPSAAPLPSPPPQAVTRPQPLQPLTPLEPPEVKPEVVKPPVAAKTPESVKQQAVVPPKVEPSRAETPNVGVPSKVPLEVAKPPAPPQQSPKPAATLAQAEKPTPKPLAEATEPEGKREKRYTLQVATLVLERNALTLKKRLEELGYAPIIHKTTAPIARHRVFGGEFSSREEAEQTVGRLNADGFSTDLVELDDGKFGLEVGSYSSLNRAIDLAQSLQKKNYTPKIISETAPTPVHVVRVGEYEDRSEAVKALEALKRQGFTALIVTR